MTIPSKWFTEKIAGAVIDLLRDGDYRIGMIKTVPVTVRNRWAFWRRTVEQHDELQTVPAHYVREGSVIRIVADKPFTDWTWDGVGQFKEFRVWQGRNEIMRGGNLSAVPMVGDAITPNIYLDVREMFR